MVQQENLFLNCILSNSINWTRFMKKSVNVVAIKYMDQTAE